MVKVKVLSFEVLRVFLSENNLQYYTSVLSLWMFVSVNIKSLSGSLSHKNKTPHGFQLQ
jgi:hypothetical protein